MEIKELTKKIEEQAFRLKNAKANGTMVAQETERMKNILMNSIDGIVEGLKKVEKLTEEIEILNAELDDAEAELKEKDQEIDKLTGKKTTNGAKKKAEPAQKEEPVPEGNE